MRLINFVLVLAILVSGCTSGSSGNSTPTAEDAKKFMDDVNDTLFKLGLEASQAGWVSETYITDDTSALFARANQRLIDKTAQYAKEGEELTKIAADLDATYGKGKWCEDPKKSESCLDINQISDIMRDSQDEKKLRQVWEGWHTISLPMRKEYTRFVELSNKGAKELGFADSGAMWRSKYDMSPEDFTKELDRLWTQVRPLYLKLHAYVRMKLREKYGDVVPANGPIPAHLLGNIWAQDWSNVYPLVK